MVVLVAVFVVMGRDDSPPPAPAVRVPLPSAMAAIGDSITAGVGAAPEGFDTSAAHVWATGDADDSVDSHYERLVAGNSAIRGQNHNFAVSGAVMADGPDQARQAVATGASYVTIFLGSNDVCAGSIDGMTPAAEFERDLRVTLEILSGGLPQARFFVISIPDIHHLWETFGDDPIATRVWDAAGTCGVMLDPSNTDAERQAARERNMELNEALDRVCATVDRCRYDQGAVFDHDFGEDLVAIDYFHPSHRGHEVLADLTWRYGYWPEI